MYKKANTLKRIILFFLGVFIIQLGVAIFLKTNIGSDPFTVFTQGLSFLINTTPGKANMIILLVTTVLIIIFDRKKIKIGTIICAVGVGPIIDVCINLIANLPIDSLNIVLKSIILILGCFLIAVGFSILSATNVGVAPNDIVPFIIQDKLKFEYRWIRIALDLTYFVLGALLGGVFGVGTIIAVVTTGPFIQFCLPYGERFVQLIVDCKSSEEVDTLKA